MGRFRKFWFWLGQSRNQKTLAFIGSGLAIIAGACWQLYPQFFGDHQSKNKDHLSVTATHGGVAASGGINASVIQTGPGKIEIRYGVSAEEFQKLSAELGITQSALQSFFDILERKQIPKQDLDSTLREIAKRYKELQAKLDRFNSEDPEVNTLKRQSKEALEAGRFEDAEKFLNQASEKDIRAANELQATAKKRLLSAAASKAANGDLKATQLAYADAAAYYRQAAELVPSDEEATLAVYVFFQGGSLVANGQLSEALPPVERALALREKALGPEHPEVALNLMALARLYSSVESKIAESEPLYLRALAIQEKTLGPDHSDTAINLTNLGDLYRKQGQYTKAEPLLRRALAIQEKTTGPSIFTLQSLFTLANLYHAQGRYPEAEALLTRALAVGDQSVGSDHWFTAPISTVLADLYRLQGRYAEAEPLFKRVLVINEKSFGPNHVIVAESLANLAMLYRDQGHYTKAESLLKRALPIVEQALGSDNREIAQILDGLALLYSKQDRYAEAESLFKRAMAIQEQALGPNHPELAQTLIVKPINFHSN